MLRLTSLLLALFLVVGLTGCGEKSKKDPQPVVLTTGKAIVIQENNGTAYNLRDVSLTTTGGGNVPRVWSFSGKLLDGRLLRVQYTESGGTGRSQNVSLATLDNVDAIQRNGQVNYLITDNTLSGAFSVDFAGPLKVYGTFQSFPL